MPSPTQAKHIRRQRRARRVRRRIRGTTDRPRLSVFRSHRHISAQLIDDARGATLTAVSDAGFRPPKPGSGRSALLPGKPKGKSNRADRAAWVGARLAAQAIARGIRAARFDRGRYRYHGLVAAVAAGARKGGLEV